jgi:polar amino acid transport system substrate-binding protein
MRVMAGHFQEIRQAMGMPKRSGATPEAGAAYPRGFVEENGFVADALKRSGQSATVASPER